MPKPPKHSAPICHGSANLSGNAISPDTAALTGVLRILSFLGLGIALIGIGWAYGRVMGTAKVKRAIPATES